MTNRVVARLLGMADRLPRVAAPAAVLAVAAAVLVTLALRDPHRPGLYPSSPTQALLGVYCPGCGSLRGLHALATGDPVGMAARNPLLPLGICLLTWAWLAWTGRRTGWWHLRPLPSSRRFLHGFLVLVCAFAVARNLPAAPFTALAP